MAKMKLEIDYDCDFLLFGICSHVKDYRLCHYINKELGINLTKKEDVQIPLPKQDQDVGFSRYEWSNRTKEVRYIVLSNRGENAYLINEESKVDFFLLVEGQYLIVQNDELLGKLKQIPVVLTAFELEPDKLPSKHNLFIE